MSLQREREREIYCQKFYDIDPSMEPTGITISLYTPPNLAWNY